MALSAFDDKDNQPKDAQLQKVLGPAHELWAGLIMHLESEYPPVEGQWGFSGKKWGWSLRLKQKKRTILYLTPTTGYFFVGFVLGEKAATTALNTELSEGIRETIESAPKYAEGRGIRLEVRDHRDIQAVEQLAAIKMKI
jgi:hypothetical protein